MAQFPGAPSFNSGDSESAWFHWRDLTRNAQPVPEWIYQTTWMCTVRLLARTLRGIMLAQNILYYVVGDNGKCWGDKEKASLPAQLGISATDSSYRTTADIEVTGTWTPELADAVIFFLCYSGNTTAANIAWSDFAHQHISPETMRFIVWIAYFVTYGDVDFTKDVTGRISDLAKAKGNGIVLDPNTAMPAWSRNPPAVAPADVDFWTASKVGDPLPNSPAMIAAGAPNTRPWPFPASATPGPSAPPATTNAPPATTPPATTPPATNLPATTPPATPPAQVPRATGGLGKLLLGAGAVVAIAMAAGSARGKGGRGRSAPARPARARPALEAGRPRGQDAHLLIHGLPAPVVARATAMASTAGRALAGMLSSPHYEVRDSNVRTYLGRTYDALHRGDLPAARASLHQAQQVRHSLGSVRPELDVAIRKTSEAVRDTALAHRAELAARRELATHPPIRRK